MTPEAERALAYPFSPPSRGFIFVNGEAVFEDESGFREALEKGMESPRAALLASGSNASPTRLREKFGLEGMIPTLRAEVADHVVAHSAKFCSYGAMPATLFPHPGGKTRVFVNLLTENQLARMDATEDMGAEYERLEIRTRPEVGHGAEAERFEAYISLYGALTANGKPAASAASDQDAPGLTVLNQQQAIERAMDVLAVEQPLVDFITRIVREPDYRRAQNAQLKADAALPFRVAAA